MSSNKIAIIGWGSLIWDSQPDFDQYLNSWNIGGPVLPIEFCRMSRSRKSALTLVIDSSLGTRLETLYAFSRRDRPEDAICDLRCREKTLLKHIGFVNLATEKKYGRDREVITVIEKWAKTKNIDVAIWTDLPSNFGKKHPDKFFPVAFDHLRSLDQNGLREAIEYILRTPKQIDTRLRKLLMKDEWFKHQVSLYSTDA